MHKLVKKIIMLHIKSNHHVIGALVYLHLNVLIFNSQSSLWIIVYFQ